MFIMDNPECSLLSVVKVEDELKELKQESIHEDADLEFVQVEESLSVDETSTDHGAGDDSRDTLMMFSEDELARCDRALSFSKVDLGQRRRLRFSEADDMLLLARVVALNPYKCSALWKDVTQMVAMRAGKNFSVRSIRDHTDLLMNTYSLRGVDACLKRTPPELWDKKKQLLQKVQKLWKKDTLPAKLTAGNTVISSKRLGKEFVTDNQPGLQKKRAAVEAPNPDPDLSSDSSVPKSSTTQPATSRDSLLSSVLKPSSVPLLMQQQTTPVKLHFGTAPSVACTPLLASALPSNIQQLALSAQLELQKLAVPAAFPFPAWGRPVLPKLLPAPAPNSPPDPAADSISPDEPIPLVSRSSPVPAASPTPEMVDQCTSPILSVSSSSTENVPASLNDSPIVSSRSPSQASTEMDAPVTATGSKKLERSSDCTVMKRIPRTSSVLRAKLLFLQARHRDEYALRVKELHLRKQRLALEARKLDLEERKVRLEEEKWKVEKKEREEKLILITEERQNKIALERRQQSMIDILLELKKKE